MRAQIRGMHQGQRNAQDGISMLQTTEGALNETTAILQRLRELTVQAGNTTLSSSDRLAIGAEMLALRSEVDNIAVRTRFNGQQFFNGSLTVSDTATGTANATTAVANGATVSVSSINVGSAQGGTTYTLTAAGSNLVLSYTAGAVTHTESVLVNAMGANGTQAVAFSTIGVTLNLTHDANAGNVTGATIAAAFNPKTIITSASSNATFRVGAEVGASRRPSRSRRTAASRRRARSAARCRCSPPLVRRWRGTRLAAGRCACCSHRTAAASPPRSLRTA